MSLKPLLAALLAPVPGPGLGTEHMPPLTGAPQETLTVTGQLVRDAGIVAFILLVPGLILLMSSRRTRRSRRTD